MRCLRIRATPAGTARRRAARLGREAVLKVTEPQDGAPLEQGFIYVAPRDEHMLFDIERVALSRGPREHLTRPAIDQDPQEAQHPTMPRRAIAEDDVDAILPLDGIAAALVHLAHGRGPGGAARRGASVSRLAVMKSRLVQYRPMTPPADARAHSVALARLARETFATARQTCADTRAVRARARSTREISMWLREDENLSWARVAAAERGGTTAIAGGADGDGRARGRGRVVLIVDDHTDTREMYREFLKAMGFATCEATTCAEALARCRDGGIDVVVLDRQLPDGDGVDVCRTLKAETGTGALPIVILSGHQHDGASGADRYLIKPVIPDVLCRELDRLLASRPSSRASEPR